MANQVALFTGAWIEIVMLSGNSNKLTSHLSQVRGLKFERFRH